MSFDRDSDSCRNIVRSDDELLAYRNWIAERYAKAQSLYFSSLWSEAQNELKLLIGVCVYPHDFEEVFYGGCIQQIDPVMFGDVQVSIDAVKNLFEQITNRKEKMAEVISSDLPTQWQDHFHIRDQTWKVLQFSILFFVGVVGLEYKPHPVGSEFLIWAYLVVLLTAVFGVIIAIHHRRRGKEKLEMIEIYVKKLELYPLIKSVLDKSRVGHFGKVKVNTGTYIIAMQVSLAIVSFFMFLRVAFFPNM